MSEPAHFVHASARLTVAGRGLQAGISSAVSAPLHSQDTNGWFLYLLPTLYAWKQGPMFGVCLTWLGIQIYLQSE